jgi:hypothetical protein
MISAEELKLLIKAAREGDSNAHESLREYGRILRNSGAPIPRELDAYVLDWFACGASKLH